MAERKSARRKRSSSGEAAEAPPQAEPDVLSAEERRLTHEVFARGPGALRDRGWTDEAIESFMSRPPVQKEIQLLVYEYESREAIEARVRFNVRRRLARSAEDATEVLEKALQGPEYVRDEDGSVVYEYGKPKVKNPGPNTYQMQAATEILEKLGVTVPEGVTVKLEDILDTGPIREVPPEITDYPSEDERRSSHEKLRTLMELVEDDIDQKREEIEQKEAEQMRKRNKVGAQRGKAERTKKKKKKKKASAKNANRRSTKKTE